MMINELFVSTIPQRIQILAIISSITLLGVVISLIRRGMLKEGYSIIWFFVGITLVAFSVMTRLLDVLARAVGIAYSPAAFFLILTGGLFLLSLHFSVLVSKHDKRIRELAQENALLKQEVEEMKRVKNSSSYANRLEKEKNKKEQVIL